MPANTISLMATAFALLSATKAHMILNTPAIYGKASINSSPLDASGSDFPCKQRPGVYDPALSKNIMPIGVPQTLSFNGSAVHGGGSCQISLTKDLKPTKDSKWMVIHSIEGGCPAKADGNLPEVPGVDPTKTQVATKFQYTIPAGISPGDYALAWTWFNRIGNREMYMNCAPITVTGGSKRRDLDDSFNATEAYASDDIFKRDTSFPDMFKANMPATDCTTPDGKDVKFPNPGASVEMAGVASNLAAASGPKCGAASGGSDSASSGSSSGSSGASAASGSTPTAASGSSSGSGSGSGTGSAPAGAASPATTSVVAIPPAGAPGAGMASAAVSVASAAQSVASAAASVASGAGAAAPAATGSTSSGSGSASSGSSPGSSGASSGSGSSAGSSSGSTGGAAAGTSTGSCTTPGQTVCSPDGTKIGTCDQNKSVVFMAVAPGTKCSGGQMLALGSQKRSAKFAKSYKA
ncbi:MAG: hypothetical protein LQ338_006464 [Usnochroma carphineum]|nr:MAG: hypothetical protein LQ338_006464 [Usnochroma carphineum]